tara:strand:+ start:356 stop:496 length:141 start_codon:yes stop_codon:yes gene_type:complete
MKTILCGFGLIVSALMIFTAMAGGLFELVVFGAGAAWLLVETGRQL